MHSRQTTLHIDPSRVDDVVRRFREQVVPVLRQNGAKGARMLVDRKTGKVQAVSLFESASALQAAESALDQQRDQARQDFGATSATTEMFEIAVYEDF
jgi:hypothetical protein